MVSFTSIITSTNDKSTYHTTQSQQSKANHKLPIMKLELFPLILTIFLFHNLANGYLMPKPVPPEVDFNKRLANAYKEWCETYQDEINESRWEIFSYNYYQTEAYRATTGLPLILNEYADMTCAEYNRLQEMHGMFQQQPQQVNGITSQGKGVTFPTLTASSSPIQSLADRNQFSFIPHSLNSPKTTDYSDWTKVHFLSCPLDSSIEQTTLPQSLSSDTQNEFQVIENDVVDIKQMPPLETLFAIRNEVETMLRIKLEETKLHLESKLENWDPR